MRCNIAYIYIDPRPQDYFTFYSLQYLWESDLLNYWLKKYTPNINKCMIAKTKPRGRMTSFTLVDLSSAFTILSFGIGLSLFVFILEKNAHLIIFNQQNTGSLILNREENSRKTKYISLNLYQFDSTLKLLEQCISYFKRFLLFSID